MCRLENLFLKKKFPFKKKSGQINLSFIDQVDIPLLLFNSMDGKTSPGMQENGNRKKREVKNIKEKRKREKKFIEK